MEMSAVLGFAAIALTMIAVPGPDWAYVLGVGARDRVLVPAVGGLMVGYVLITLVVSVGVGGLIAAQPIALMVLTVAGALYLIRLGIGTLRAARTAAFGAGEVLTVSPRGTFTRGIAVSGLNPKGVLIFVSILPQFAHAQDTWPLPAQLALLGTVFVLLAGSFYLPMGVVMERVLRARPSIAGLVTRIAGTAMILVGVSLLAERVVVALG
ncbi:LysE family translocator [Nocardioides nematodiphilus]|uniref:LysE family translocator n=1 Tax=Nocardioides nematodiphilus TaxID=2849669 RepID=UPI001CD933BB|nr:LysE family translocator [Nocardioides nematodiphilus]MCA1983833.1 LysE family translocator [Nocardioides nematodiphilus]